MKLRSPRLFAAVTAALLASAGTLALALQDQPAMPSAGPAHAVLLERVGTWDCTMKMWAGPGEPMTTTGTEVDRAVGQFHVLADFEADMMGMPFEGHGITSYDPTKKTYVSIWVDSVEPTPARLEGSYDEATRTFRFEGDAMMMGQRMHMRQVLVSKDADHHTLDMFITPPGGEEMQSMRIDYTRRK